MSDIISTSSYLEQNTYDAGQLCAYYDRILLPPAERRKPGVDSATVSQDPDQGLAFLTTLQQHHIKNIPFENLDLHYSRHQDIFIDPPHLFRKIVDSGQGRGGYCMESNGLFGAVLRSLGFNVYPAGARIYNANVPLNEANSPQFNGWSHMLHIVTFGTHRYFVDVAFGSSGPTSPVLIDDSSTSPVINTAPQVRRVRRIVLPDSVKKSGSDQHLWIFEVQHEPEHATPWLPMYCFSEMEFLPADFDIINFYTSKSPTSIFTHNVVCARHIFEDQIAVGTVSLWGRQLKHRERGKKVLDVELQTEQERIDALKEHFGISLTLDERAAILRYSSAIR